MILDDLFNQAAKDAVRPKLDAITVQANVTANRTGGFKSSGNASSAPAPVTLKYKAGTHKVTKLGFNFSPASFAGTGGSPSLTITAPVPLPLGGSYSVRRGGLTFTPEVDLTTGVVYGAAGSDLVTISLCNYRVTFIPD